MTHEIETMDARSAISQMQSTVLRELSDLHIDKRDRDAVIESQQQQIKFLREGSEVERKRLQGDSECWKKRYVSTHLRWQHSDKVTGQSIVVMFAACAAAFVAIGYAVWVG